MNRAPKLLNYRHAAPGVPVPQPVCALVCFKCGWHGPSDDADMHPSGTCRGPWCGGLLYRDAPARRTPGPDPAQNGSIAGRFAVARGRLA